ncbi:MAG: S-layer homology domain-containing protein [Eubacteriales bacterium]
MIKVKRFFKFVVLSILILSMMSTATAATLESNEVEEGFHNFEFKNEYSADLFGDVEETNWFYSNVTKVYELGIMIGYGNGTFQPEDNLTIAESITLASIIHSTYKMGEADFDQSETDWYQAYVDYAKENGIIDQDYPDYNEEATRADFVQIFGKSLPQEALEEINIVEDDNIPDVNTDAIYGTAVYMLYRAGVIVGNDEEGTFEPEESITRAEAAAIITRMVIPEMRQIINVGTLKGIVVDASTKEPIKGAEVAIYDETINTDRSIKTSSTGQFSLQIPAGTGYTAKIEKEGYISEGYQNIDIINGEVNYLETILQINEENLGLGNASGKVVNALDGNGIAGLTIDLRKGLNVTEGDIVKTVETESEGYYEIEELEAGNYTAQISGTGYNTGYFTIFSLGGETTDNQDATITPNLAEGEIRIVLTWGDTPRDLDSHLTGPTEDESRFHIYFVYKEYGDYANLDLDDINCYGPETTTIVQQTNGIYRFTVHDYTNEEAEYSTDLANSDATVKIYRGEYLIKTYHVPNDQDGIVWNVFELNGNELNSINQMSYDMETINP